MTAYVENHWTPTVWELTALYASDADGTAEHGSATSIRVARIGGKLEIETDSDTLRAIAIKLSEQINERQTDEWYMRNLARVLPPVVEGLTLVHVEVLERVVGTGRYVVSGS